MAERTNLYVAGFVAASLSYIVNVLAFTGGMDTRRWAVFVVLFLGLMYGGERVLGWAAARE